MELRGAVALVHGGARELARLVVPVACAGCGAVDVRCCPACAGPFVSGPHRVERAAPRLDRLDGVPPLPVWALAPYAAEVREVVVAWKDRGRVDLDGLLAPALRRAARQVAGVVGEASGGRAVLVVAAPSTAAARRARGREHVAALAAGVAQGLLDAGVRADVVRVLRRRGPGRDQVGLGARARGRNLAAGVAVRPRALARAGPAPAGAALSRTGGAACLLVDDVVTTGATLAASERALEAAGADVVAALVVAATPPPGSRREVSGPSSSPVYQGCDVGLA